MPRPQNGPSPYRFTQLKEPLYLVPASWVELEFAAFPACPGVGCHVEQLRRFGLRQVTQRTSQIDQVQIHVAGPRRTRRHV